MMCISASYDAFLIPLLGGWCEKLEFGCIIVGWEGSVHYDWSASGDTGSCDEGAHAEVFWAGTSSTKKF